MTNIATYTPREVETRVVQEEVITLNLTVRQAQVIFGAIRRTNGDETFAIFSALAKIFADNKIEEPPRFLSREGKAVVLDANKHGF